MTPFRLGSAHDARSEDILVEGHDNGWLVTVGAANIFYAQSTSGNVREVAIRAACSRAVKLGVRVWARERPGDDWLRLEPEDWLAGSGD